VGNKKHTLQNLQDKIDAIYEPGLIVIAPNQEYVGIRHPLVFIDRDYGEWSSAPFNVIQNKNTHPERSQERRRRTNLEKYGHENCFGSAAVRDKIKATNLERYGAENPAQSAAVREKVIQTNLAVYGCKTPISQNEEVREKAKQTNLTRYGVENAAHSDLLLEKKKETCLLKYGTAFVLQAEEVKEKICKTNQEKLGVSYPTQSSEVREKVRHTFQERYGGHPLTTELVKAKRRQTCQLKYGVSSHKQRDTPVLPNGMLLSDYIRLHKPDMYYTSSLYILKRHGFEILRQCVEEGLSLEKDNALEKAVAVALNLRTFKKRLGPINRFPDFALSESVYLDIDGLYWHSEAIQKDKAYHFRKRLQYEEAGLRLIQIREDETRSRAEIVKYLVNNVLGLNSKVYARTTTLREVPFKQAREFLDANHLQGAGSNAQCWGLYKDDILLMLMAVRRYKEGLELSRLCSLNGHTVVGGFSKLLAHLEKERKTPFLISWCDLRYASGSGYEKVGFEKVRDVQGWSWTDFENTFNRRQCRAGDGLTEREHAKALRWVKIYDAGQRLYIKHFR